MKPPRAGAEPVPVLLPRAPHLLDHRTGGRAVFPAVEAVQFLADRAAEALPGLPLHDLRDARFPRFLEIPDDGPAVAAQVTVRPAPEGGATAALATRSAAGRSGIVRVAEHARVTFAAGPDPVPPPPEILAAPAGPVALVPAARLYAELVPFGPAFRNALDPIALGPDGGTARLQAPELPGAPRSLGSPFPLDAAFHVACAWGQRFHGRVLFPVGWDRRRILRPIAPGAAAGCRVLAREVTPEHGTFDLWLFQPDDGTPLEALLGLHMADVSHGTLAAPDWLRAGADLDPFAAFRSRCLALEVLELESLLPFAAAALGRRERERLAQLGPSRGRAFLAAHLALKRAVRRLPEPPASLASTDIVTVDDDLEKPALLWPGLSPETRFASLAHDKRFAFAAVADGPVGLDVERVGPRAVRGLGLYTSAGERPAVDRSGLAPDEAATRIWSLKEAVSKASGLHLVYAWREVEVRAVGAARSEFVFHGGSGEALHAQVDDHVFTLVRLAPEPSGGGR